MKKLIEKTIILLSVLAAFSICVFVFDHNIIGSQYIYNYQASLIDKVARLKSIKEPKIILVGNSSLSFGIQSDILQDEMDMPVVNLGLHGGLGNAFHEDIAKLCINEGDIIVVCHSSFMDDDTIADPALAWITYDMHDELLPIFRKKDYFCMLKAYPDYFKRTIGIWLTKHGNSDVGGCYSRNAFNEYGDIAYRPDNGKLEPDDIFAKTTRGVPNINQTCMNRLNEFRRYAADRGAVVVIAGYPIGYGKYAKFTGEDFERFQSELDENFDGDVISDYTDYFYPYDMFYNTDLHMTQEGAKARTRQLASDLKAWEKNRR